MLQNVQCNLFCEKINTNYHLTCDYMVIEFLVFDI